NVTTVTSDTSITLTQKYVGDAALSGSSYVYFEDEYALASDFLKPIDWRSFSSALNIPIIGRNEFRVRFPRPNIAGRPKIANVLDKPFSGSTTPVKRVQFFPYPDAVYNIPYSYITSNLAVSSAGVEAAQLSADADEPNLPYRYRHAIVLKAAEQWYRDRKDDGRSAACGQEYVDSVQRIVGDQPIGTAARGHLAPRSGHYEGYARKPYTRGAYGKRFSVNNSFDYFEDR
ncbi:MAG: hypothetical protein MN733_29795, partial [Nitrososphaera sp.]|nr:hypothetical protein [Nitrososphaera sp.]